MKNKLIAKNQQGARMERTYERACITTCFYKI